jgi:hypothetical protein
LRHGWRGNGFWHMECAFYFRKAFFFKTDHLQLEGTKTSYHVDMVSLIKQQPAIITYLGLLDQQSLSLQQ